MLDAGFAYDLFNKGTQTGLVLFFFGLECFLTKPISRPCSDHHNVALPCLVVRSYTDTHAGAGGVGDVGEVADLGVSKVYLDIDQDERVGDRAADLAGADDGDPGGRAGGFGGHC